MNFIRNALVALAVLFTPLAATAGELDGRIPQPYFQEMPGLPTKNLTVDPGGSVTERMRTIELLRSANAKVEIDGLCISACTMLLSLENACVKPYTIFGFHSASQGFGEMSPFGNAIISMFYPPAIMKWVEETKALSSLDLTPMTAERAWELGVKKCDTDTVNGPTPEEVKDFVKTLEKHIDTYTEEKKNAQ